MREQIAEFYKRNDVVIELLGLIVLGLLEYAEKLPMWAIVTLIVVRQAVALRSKIVATK